MRSVFFVLLAALSFAFEARAARELPRLNIDRDQIVVAGFSSGGIMAVQLGVAHSSTFHGVAVFAGGMYGCTDRVTARSKNCLTRPEQPRSDVKSYLVFKNSEGLIDSPANIEKQSIYLFAGTRDQIVGMLPMMNLEKFYKILGAGPHLKMDVYNAGHGFPTLFPAQPCASSQSPWFINCGFSGAQAALEHIVGKRKIPVSAWPRRLTAFDQSLYANAEASMSREGWVYVPRRCREGSVRCGLIVALHGCGQSSDTIGPLFARWSGFNEWAEANDFVVLYPAVRPGWIVNRAACWDWWGYTGEHIYDQKAPQIRAIMNMVNRLKSGAS